MLPSVNSNRVFSKIDVYSDEEKSNKLAEMRRAGLTLVSETHMEKDGVPFHRLSFKAMKKTDFYNGVITQNSKTAERPFFKDR